MPTTWPLSGTDANVLERSPYATVRPRRVVERDVVTAAYQIQSSVDAKSVGSFEGVANETPADKVRGADWHPPLRDLVAKAWADNPERDRLEQLWSERSVNSDHLWHQAVEPDPADAEFELPMPRPVDPRETRPAEASRPLVVNARTLPVDSAQAIVALEPEFLRGVLGSGPA
jgi:hypothetical protein